MLSQSSQSESLEEMFASLLSGGLITYGDLIEQGFDTAISHLMCPKVSESSICEEKASLRRTRQRMRDDDADIHIWRCRNDPGPCPLTQDSAASCLDFRRRDELAIHDISSALQNQRRPSERNCPLDM